jgi:hypothetical protein
MDSALSGQRRVLEKFFPSSPRQDPIYVKPTIFVVIGLGLVVPILLSAPYLHTLWFCNVGLQRFSSEGREIAKYWCDWVVLICQFSLFLIVGGVVVTEQFTDQIRTRIQNSEETFDRLLSQLVQRAQPVKTEIYQKMDDILQQSGKLSIIDNIKVFTRIYREIGVLLRILPFIPDFRFRFAISFMRNIPGRSHGVIIFFVILLLLVDSSLKISFDYSAFGCPPSPPEVTASNLISRYPSPAGRDTHDSKIEPAWPTILEYRFLPGQSDPMVGRLDPDRPPRDISLARRRLRFIDDGGGSEFLRA